ncbi:hypothetical protein RIF29_27769 [Crotalaria pallida]|uniref:Integral membrane bound transporter domain-containing protein n=1 Tax=Crotalaria pallida TaxID=3830 RepID=A0AAN9EQC8_CROPI
MDKLSLPTALSFTIPPLWRTCLSSTLRTALACTIVGIVTLYGPPYIQTLISFPAFSYVTVILIIINDATLGDSFQAIWIALYATFQSIGPAMLCFCAINPNRFSEWTIALAVALAAFVVVLPKSTHLIAKRISLGQIVLAYVVGYADGDKADPLLHPLRLAASTALGVIACVGALLLPYPRLASSQVKQNYKLLTKNILNRVKLLVKAVCEEDMTSALSIMSHAKSLLAIRTKLLQIIMRYQESMQWEKPLNKLFRPHCLSPGERLQEIDTNLRGMELALSCINSFPIKIHNGELELKHSLNSLEEHLSLTIKQAKHTFQGVSKTVPESNAKTITHFLQTLHTIPTTHQDLPIYFFLFCSRLLDKNSLANAPICDQKNENFPKGKEKWANWVPTLISPNLIAAIKYSLSLGLAVFMGLIYSKENGFWAGLPVAVSYVSGRQATFRIANVKAQGTVLGTVYGVLCSFVFERFLPIRFFSLLPWFLFTSFLQRSRMYGQAGGISAAIGAVLILGRENFGPPSEFAIARIIETFIGLACSVFVELIFIPKMASSCAKIELSQSLAILDESIGSFSLIEVVDETGLQVNELRKFILEAEIEPNFWFLPFHATCYNKILGSLSKLVDVLHFGVHALKFLHQEFKRVEAFGKEEVNMLQGELRQMKELICSSIKSLEEITRMKSLKFVEDELGKKNMNMPCDLESGKPTNRCMVYVLGEDGIEKTISSFLQRSRDVVDNIYGGEGEKELNSQVVLCLSTLGFCLGALMRETIEIEKGIKELVQWENPSREINLYEILCKLQDLKIE